MYEAAQHNTLNCVNSFRLPYCTDYFIYKINSRVDLLAWENLNKSTKIVFNGFNEADVPEKIKGYFVAHYEDEGDCTPHECLEPIDSFIKNLSSEVEEERNSLKEKEHALKILEEVHAHI